MNRNLIKKTLLFVIFSSLCSHDALAGAGKSFGLFAGGAVAGGLIGSAIAKRDRRQPTTVVQERVVERPVYVQQPAAQPVIVQQPAPAQTTQASANAQEAADLQNRLHEQDERIKRLEQELKKERREAEKRKDKIKETPPKTRLELEDTLFDGFEPEDQ